MAAPSPTRLPLADLGLLRLRWPRRRWLEVPGHVLRQGRVLLPGRRVTLAEVASVRFVPGSRSLSLAVAAGAGEVRVELLRLGLRELSRTPAELGALADGLDAAAGPDAAAAADALRRQARHLSTEHSGGALVSPLAPFVGRQKASWSDLFP